MPATLHGTPAATDTTNPGIYDIPLSATADGSQEVVAAVADRKIRVLAYVVTASAAGSVTWLSAATALTGAMYIAANAAIVAPHNVDGWFETVAGEALNISNSAGLDSKGHLVYILI